MSKAIGEIIAGAALIALDIVAPYIGLPLTATMLSAIGATGASLVMGGIGTLLTKQMQGLSSSVRNPIQPWNVVYGQAHVGGTIVYMEETGESDKYLHMVYVLACHPCRSVDAILFDGKRIILSDNTSGDSFSPSQATQNISSIVRTNDVVTVTFASPIDGLISGDFIQIQDAGDATLNGTFPVTVVNSTTVTYISGGNAVSTSGGTAGTTWPNYGDTVHVEVALGTQTSNPFPGLTAGGDTGSQGLWTSAHSLSGRTAVYLRLKYGGNTYASGMPTISFLVSGKADIYDPRTGSSGYTTNSALVTADYLAQPVWGFKAAYGTEIPYGPLIAAANICDEAPALGNGGVEARYTANGTFQLSAKRGEVLQNLLTSCGGKLTYTGGQFIINPAAWTGATIQMGSATPTNASGAVVTSATLTIWASWVPGDAGIGAPHIDIVYGQLNMTQINQSADGVAISTAGLTSSPSALTASIPVADLYRLSQTSIVAYIVGTLFGDDTSQLSTLKIYNVALGVTYGDGTSATVGAASTRQSSGSGSGIFYAGISGTVTNASNAITADSSTPTTFASIVRGHYNGLASAGYLQVSGFAFPTFNGVSPTAAALTFAAGAFQWKPKVPIRDLYNGVKATYINPSNNWQASDMPPYAQDADHGYGTDALLAADGGERRWKDIQLPFTNSVSTAQRLAKIELMRSRQEGTGTFIFNLAMYQCTALDVIAMTLPLLGWNGKLLEVAAHRFTVSKHEHEGGSGMLLGTEIDVQETDPSVYEWNAGEELSAQGYRQAGLGVQTVLPPIGATATSGTGVAADVGGLQQARVQVTWTAPTDGYVVNGGSAVVQYQTTGDTTWTALGNYDSTTTSAYINGVSDGTSYTARIAYMSAQGIQSDWNTLAPIVASGSTGMHFVNNETPAGAINGTNVTFTLAHAPSPSNSLKLFLNQGQVVYGTDFTLSGLTITLVNATPKTGDTLRADYRY